MGKDSKKKGQAAKGEAAGGGSGGGRGKKSNPLKPGSMEEIQANLEQQRTFLTCAADENKHVRSCDPTRVKLVFFGGQFSPQPPPCDDAMVPHTPPTDGP